YWPSSPSNGPGIYGDSNERSQGDTHYWEVWHGGKPFSEYLTVLPRMSSEYGFQSVPSLETLAPVMEKDDFNIASPMIDYRQRSAIGNRAMVEHMMGEYLLPKDFEQFIYLSQVQQAMAMKIATEHWRRLLPINMGTMIWQLNDIWPGNSWSSIEYGGKWKVLHSFSKRFFAPLLISIAKNKDGIEVWVTHDGPNSFDDSFTLEVRDFQGNILNQWSQRYQIGPLESRPVFSIDYEGFRRIAPLSELFVVLHRQGDPAFDWSLLDAAKHSPLRTPNIEVKTLVQDGATLIELQTDYPAFHLWLDIPGRRGTYDDNGFVLLPDYPKRVIFEPKDDLGQVTADQIRLYHLRGSF
ncbi:MAG TPA: glycoside hydrolase family 2 protein, partial [Bacillota bacterium]|nr:glycoside hydrolase family 2 protein [Bacillota bacterium]